MKWVYTALAVVIVVFGFIVLFHHPVDISANYTGWYYQGIVNPYEANGAPHVSLDNPTFKSDLGQFKTNDECLKWAGDIKAELDKTRPASSTNGDGFQCIQSCKSYGPTGSQIICPHAQ